MPDELGRAWNTLGRVHRGDLKNQPFAKKKQLDEMNPDRGGNMGLGVARVVAIDYEEHYVTLRTVIGTEQEFERVPVPLTYPGAGTRHFLGAMPEVGDYCVIGWLPQESSEKWGGSATPVILTWVLPGVWPGRDWLTLSNFTEDEHDGGTSRSKEEIHGIFDRIRHKLRHIQPGNIVASSSQGSDLVLDEDVLLTNRRGNQILLRDADQAVVTRALQQFTALAGSRTYAGMVQRDALRLPTTMFSDGHTWDGAIQAYAGAPLHENDLPLSENYPNNHLTPDPMLARNFGPEGDLSGAVYSYPKHLDPYVFLHTGGYIDEEGVAYDSRHLNDAVYGGKNLYRIGPGSQDNATLLPGASILTEHRIEVSHTSDGRLPVTEQTDGFDAERLPDSDQSTPGVSGNQPFIEWVLGSVVGNDPFTQLGRPQYGLPMVTQVFDGMGGLSPRMFPARIAAPGQSGGTPLGQHAATLFKLTPVKGDMPPTWWSVNKRGEVNISISGHTSGYGVNAAIAGGMRLAMGGGLDLQLKGGIRLGTLSKDSLRLRSELGPVVIYGGGPTRDEEAVMERLQGTQGGEGGSTPSVDIHARTNLRLRAEKKILVKGQEIEENAKVVRAIGHDLVEITSAKQIHSSTEDYKSTVTGKRVDNFTGPKNLLPTNGALHERSYTPNFPGVVCEEVTYEMGDREETFKLGNHKTSILIGNMTYETEVGTWKARAFQNSVEIGAGGITADALVGNVKLNATAGAAVMKGLVAVQIESNGPVSIRSGTVITLASPGNGLDIGPVICAGSREPFTNLPFATWGLGAKTVVVTP